MRDLKSSSQLVFYYLKMGHSRPLYFLFSVFSIQLTVNVQHKFLPLTGFEPRNSGIGSDHSTNLAKTTAPAANLLIGFVI